MRHLNTLFRRGRAAMILLVLAALLTACAAPAAQPSASVIVAAAVSPPGEPTPTAPPSPTLAPMATAAPPTPTAAPTASPTAAPTEAPKPTAAPTAPERPAGMTVFAGFTAALENGRWVQRNAKWESRTVWDAENGKWVIDSSVTRLAIGTEMEDAGMVAALPAAEIAELMRLPQNQNKVPLPIGLGPKVVVAEVSSTVPNLVFDGMASVTIYFVFDGAYSKGIGTDGDLVKFTVLIGQRHCGFYLPKRYESKVSAVGRLGELMAVFDGGTKMVSTAAIGGHELAVACNTDGKARFEDVLTNSRGQMVVFSGK